MKPCFEYRPEVDGLRGISILLVVIYHFFPKTLPGGFIGVDVFFVISGYLITGISRSKYLDGTWSSLSFYSARIRRLFPSLLIVISFSLVIGWYSLLHSEYLELARHAKAGLGFFENFVLIRESGYFGGAIGLKPLAHLWSLSIEEQFYLMFPLLVLFTKGWDRHAIKIMSLILFGSFFTNLYRAYLVPSDVYLSPATRFWELMSGAVLSLLHTRMAPNKDHINQKESYSFAFRELLAICGIFLIIVPAFWINETTIFPGWPAVLPVAGAITLIHLGRGSRTILFAISNRPIILIGLISYPLYLWHWLLRSFLLLDSGLEPSTLSRCITMMIAGLLAYACYRWIETPIRQSKRRTMFSLLLLATAVAVTLAASVIVGKKGFPSRFPDLVDKAEIIKEVFPSEWRIGRCLLKGIQTPVDLAAECFADSHDVSKTHKNQISVLLWGDSYAAHLYPGLKSFQDGVANITQINMVACFPSKGFQSKNSQNCWMLYDFVMSHLAQHRYDLIIVAANWDSYSWDIIEDDFTSTLRELRAVSPNSIVVFGPPPRWTKPLWKVMATKFRRFSIQGLPERLREDLSQKTFEFDDRMAGIASSQHVGYISIVEHLCDQNGCLARMGSQLTSMDDGHLYPEASHALFDSVTDLMGRQHH